MYHCVKKMVAYRPNVVVVEKSVSRLAQEFLLEEGITLLYNVKLSVMERLARFTQAHIVSSIDGLVSKPNMGFCHDFRVQTYTLPNKETKTLTFFDGCATHLGCTVLLSGGTYNELHKVKQIVKFMTYTAYNSLLELCFCMDEFALPQPGADEIGHPLEALESSLNSTASDGPITSGLQNLCPETTRAISLDEGSMSKPSSQAKTKGESEEGMDRGSGLVNSAGSGKVPQGLEQQKTSSMGSKQSSTSKLTELTDCSDPLLGYQSTRDESIFHSDASRTLKEIKQTRYKLFRRALDRVHLTVSPYHKYHVPFIETDKGAKCAVRKYIPPNVFWSPLFDGESDDGGHPELAKLKKAGDLEKKRDKVLASAEHIALSAEVLGSGPTSKAMLPKSNVQLLHAHPLITCSLTEPIWDLDTQSILADFRARGGRILVPDQTNGKQARLNAEANLRRLEESTATDAASDKSGPMWMKRIDCLDIMNHQRLMVLFSSYSYKSNNHPFPCVYPWVVSMDYYGRNDITLGGFLERFCFRLQYSCPSPTCDAPMMDHIRRFVHGNACINVLLKHLDSEVPGARDNILMWSWCRKCKQVTPVVPISSDTWSLSFAKYLDLRFHGSSFLRRATAEPCTHSLHHDHFQYFGHRNIVASFKYAPISLKELALPKTSVTLEPPVFDPDQLADAMKMITYKAMDRYSLMLESTMKLKQEIMSEAQTRTIGDFLAEQQADKKNFRDSASNIQMKIQELIFSVTCLVENGQTDLDMSCHLFSIFDSVELLKRQICNDVLKWNSKMQEFMTSYQKKSRLQSLNKKEKETGLVLHDELEKSLKHGAARGGAASLGNVNAAVQQPLAKPAVTSATSAPTIVVVAPAAAVTNATSTLSASSSAAPSLSQTSDAAAVTTTTAATTTAAAATTAAATAASNSREEENGSSSKKEETDPTVSVNVTGDNKTGVESTNQQNTAAAALPAEGQENSKLGVGVTTSQVSSQSSSPEPVDATATADPKKENSDNETGTNLQPSITTTVPKDEEPTLAPSLSSTTTTTTTVASQPPPSNPIQVSHPAPTATTAATSE
ncbi:hypothetical protein EGW08_011772, partial [Elysia chlorotica]